MNRSRVTGDLASHGNIFVDIANDRVGIGSTIPGQKLSLPDNAKIALGNSADLQISHDGSHSFLQNTTGLLILQDTSGIYLRTDDLRLQSDGGSETYATLTKNGAVSLNFDNNNRFQTKDYGAEVIGTTDTDGLIVSGITTFSNATTIVNGGYHRGIINSGAQAKIIGGYISGSDTLRLGESMYLTTTGLGINESNLGHRLTVGGDGYFGFTTPNDAARQIIFNANRGSAGQTLANINWQWNSKFVAQIRGIAGSDTTNKDDGHLAFFTSSANSLIERLRINSSGQVSLGNNPTVDSDAALHIELTGAREYLRLDADAGNNNAYIEIQADDNRRKALIFTSGGTRRGVIGVGDSDEAANATSLFFSASANVGGNSPHMVITSSGDFGTNGVTPTTQSGRVFHLHAGAAQQRFHMTNNSSGVSATDGFEILIDTETNPNCRIRNFEAGYMAFDTGGSNNEVMRLTSGGDVHINSTALSSPYTSAFRNFSINNNLILNAQNSAGGFAGMQNNAYLNSSGQWVRVNNDHATSIGTDDGNVYFRNAAAGTGTISWTHLLTILANGNIGINNSNPSVQFQLTNTSATILRTEATANDGDALIQALGKDSSGNDRMIQMRTDAGADQYRIISADTSYNLALCTGNSPRILIAGGSAATSIGGSNTFNAMLTVQGDISGALFQLKATENTNRLMVSGSNTNGVEVNLYDEGGSQKGILGVSGSEFFIKAPHSSAPLKFYTHNGSSMGERVQIDSAGRLLVSRTSANLNAELQVGGRYVDASGSTLNLDGTGSDGAVLHLMETGNTADRIAVMVFDHGSLKSAIGGGRGNASNWGTDLRFYTHKEATSDIHQTYERMRIRPDAITTFGSSGSPYSSNTVSIHPDDGMVCFGMDGRTSLMSNQNSCYIFSGSGASGDIPAGTLILQSRSNVDRDIVFATGATPSEKWVIAGASGALKSYNYLPAGGYSSSTSNGFDIYLKLQGTLPTANSGVETTIITTNQIADAGVYILVLRSFEQSQTGGKLWSVRIVSSTFYIHSGSGNDAETVTVPVTHMGHHNSGSNPPVTIKMHFDNGPAHTSGKITYTPNNFSYGGSNCDYYFYKLIDV